MVTCVGTETLYFVEGIGNAFHFILHLQMPGLVQNNLCWTQQYPTSQDVATHSYEFCKLPCPFSILDAI